MDFQQRAGFCYGMFFALTMTPQTAHALEALVIQQNQDRVELGLHLEYLEDKEGQLTLENVRAEGVQSQWRANLKANPNFGYSSSAFWLRGTMQGPSETELSRILQVAYAVLDDVRFYSLLDGEIVHKVQTGDAYLFEQRPVWNRNFLFPIEIGAGETIEFYFRIKSTSSVQAPLILWQDRAFARAEQTDIYSQSMYYGIILVMAVFNFFLFLSIREKTYLYYVIYVSLTGLWFASLKGVAFQYLWPDAIVWNGLSLYILGPTLFASLTLFTDDFLHLKETSETGRKICMGLFVANCVAAILALFCPMSIIAPLNILIVISTVTFCLIIGTILWSRGQKPARYFTIAFAAFLLGTITFLLNKLGILPRSTITENAIIIGSALEVTLLSMALGARIQFLKRQKNKAVQEARQAHIQLIQTEKLASLGQLISSIGHEISNPLSTLKLSSHLIHEGFTELRNVFYSLFDDSPEAQAVLKRLRFKLDEISARLYDQDVATTRLTDISNALRSQARTDLQESNSLNVNDIIQESLIIVSGKTKVFEVNDNLGEIPLITGHRSQLGQVVTNLLSNAADALEEKRVARLEKGERFTGRIQIATYTRQNGKSSEACIVIADNGNGVPVDIQTKIFDAFFTTKEAGSGTGLGLSMSADIIQAHGGHLAVTDDDDLGGARFEIHLPA